jgi:hypothetical protein
VWELPKFANGNSFVKQVVNGWELAPVFLVRSGQPVTFTNGFDVAGVNSNRTSRQRPNIVGNPVIQGNRPKSAWLLTYFNKSAFALPTPGTFGNVGRNFVDGPGFFQLDLGVYKNFSLWEWGRLQFRSEFYNLTNRANFQNPNSSISSGNFGRITSTQGARVIQFALKLAF